MTVFVFHFEIRRGLGPVWEPRTEEVALDDMSEDLSHHELKDLAIREFKERRGHHGTAETAYKTKDIQTA